MLTLYAEDFAQWRAQSRALLAQGITPLDVSWQATEQPSLFGETKLIPAPEHTQLQVPSAFLPLAETLACHRDIRKWELLYQLVFRLAHGEKHLLKITTDPLVRALELMRGNVRRDAHKAKAFVRFRKVEEEGQEHYIAWHRPDHFILPLVAPFFARRFSSMRWTILTPDQTVSWDGEFLTYGPGVAASEAPQEDAMEDVWRSFYRAIFNPARIKLKMMRREMPVRHWPTLPETQIIADMLREAPGRVQGMLQHSEGSTQSASNYLPEQATTLPALRAAAKNCEGCELHNAATRTVFGEGPPDARIMLVGEQPGNEEDLEGVPFIGPAGQVLNEALAQVGLMRADLYITNAVKHFRFLYKDSFRQHQSPSRYHVQACKPWLTAEIAAIKPALIVCLGNTAARALISPNFVMRDGRGIPLGESPTLLATYHPSAILRLPSKERAHAQQDFVNDLALAKQWLAS
jgi:probable DNA metabolism protein